MTVAELKAELERIIGRLKADPSVRKVLLFGPLARGDARDHSDIDLIVVKETKERFLDRLDEFYDDAREAMDILVYTPQEFEEMKERPFIKRAPSRRKDALCGRFPQSPSRGDGFPMVTDVDQKYGKLFLLRRYAA